MNVYLGHHASLQYLRSWSRANPLTVRAFHELKGYPASLFPAAHFSTTASLISPAFRERDIFAVLAQCDDSFLQALAIAACNDTSAQPLAHEAPDGSSAVFPLDTLTDQAGLKNTPRLVYHRTAISHPRNSFLKIAPQVRIESPELVFARFAAELSLGSLLALGYELCGCYPLSDEPGVKLVRRPLTSPGRLIAFCHQLQQAPGVKLARVAAKEVRSRAASPKEAELAITAFTSVRRGGYGLPEAKLNEPVRLSPAAAQIARSSSVTCDIYWPNAAFALEYDGKAFHSGQMTRDSRRRDALAIDGVEMLTITEAQLSSVTECATIMEHASTRTGKRVRERGPKFFPAHMALRQGVREFHYNQRRRDNGPGIKNDDRC